MTKDKHQRQLAENRMKLIAPLLTPSLDKASYQKLKDQISQETGLSERTLRRYLSRYQERGYDGLIYGAQSQKPIIDDHMVSLVIGGEMA
ncbi:helix-turn-helix domain-containing protein [Anoxynatronum buryatiense]|uniref:Homeodomain-like domain-containing protein n=1 Tax=Anoxynatronum buryatiense TaxID=489973 RepID=A0AA46AHC6_9CLOT|nr:helix-turn-helix domain-containing protein [Anoxynatronum buryatiense]SMP38735.1 Homeodomain-like domain-containing protein [Anoxynatronum buryatiense]